MFTYVASVLFSVKEGRDQTHNNCKESLSPGSHLTVLGWSQFFCIFYFRKWSSCTEASGSMAEVNVLLSCGNADKTLKIERECTFNEFRAQVKSLFPHLPEVSCYMFKNLQTLICERIYM